ncbi:MAG: L-histidine N(alpha)-methyltransferase, partial [Planctomycetota bacterium]
EREILAQHGESIVSGLPEDVTLVELGSGSATKTHLIIDALLEERDSLCFSPIDVSKSALEASADSMLEAFPNLEIVAIAGEYQEGLQVREREIDGPQLILWLGSSVGNLTREEAIDFLTQLSQTMSLEDRLLIGIDLRKSARVLEPAYDDAARVTARFNQNLLNRVNTELGGRFDVGAFRHLARYDDEKGRVEMHLVSESEQSIAIDDLNLEVNFREGETIHTENSYKYSLEEIETLATRGGFEIEKQWFDSQERFSLSRMRRVS